MGRHARACDRQSGDGRNRWPGAGFRREGSRRRRARCRARLQAVGETSGQAALGDPAPLVRADHGQSGRPCAADDRRARQAAFGIARRGRLCGLLRRVQRRGSKTDLRRDDALAVSKFEDHRPEAADRRLRRDHAMEFPGGHDHAKMLTRPRRRLHLRRQARARYAADGAGARLSRPEGGHAAGRAQHHHRRCCEDRRSLHDPPCGQIHRLHRLDAGRQAVDAAGGFDGEEGRARAWRQRALHRVRRRRSRCGCRGRDCRKIPQHGTDLRLHQSTLFAGRHS